MQSKVTGGSRLFETARARGELARMGREYPRPVSRSRLLAAFLPPWGLARHRQLIRRPGSKHAWQDRAGAVGGAAAGRRWVPASAGRRARASAPRPVDRWAWRWAHSAGWRCRSSRAGGAIMDRIGCGACFRGAAEKQAKRMLGQAITEAPGEPGVAGIMSRPAGPAPPPRHAAPARTAASRFHPGRLCRPDRRPDARGPGWRHAVHVGRGGRSRRRRSAGDGGAGGRAGADDGQDRARGPAMGTSRAA